MLNFPRETTEYLPITATVDGNPTTTYDIAVVDHGARPTTWTPGPYLLQAMTPGYYDAYIRVTDTPEQPVTLAGSFLIT